MPNRKQTLGKNTVGRFTPRIPLPGQLSFLEEVPPVPDVTYVGPHKACKDCRQYKPIIEFYRNRKGRHGVDISCKECSSALHKEYSKTNTLKLRLNTVNHRARSLGIPGTLQVADITDLLKHSPLCAYCRLDYAALGLNWHIDHVRPLADFKKGDLLAINEIQNIALCCACCNRAKQDMPLDQFKAWLRAVQGGPSIREVRTPYAA